MKYLVSFSIILSSLSFSHAQNKDTVLVNLTNFKLLPGTFSWRGTNTHSNIVTAWNTSPYTEGHLVQGTIFKMNYRFLKPVGYDPNYQPGYPMIVMLHGGGERGNCWDTNCYFGTPAYKVTTAPTGATATQLNNLMNNDNVLSNGGQAHLNAVNLAGTVKPDNPGLDGRAFPGFVLFPQNINGWGNEAISNSDISYAIRIVRLIAKQYNIDPNRIYIHGLSLGGQGVYKALNMADWLFASAATMSGLFSNNIEYDSIFNIPLWAFQGGQDVLVTPAQTANMLDKFTTAGGIARYTLYPSLGHGTWNSAYAEPDFFIWMLTKNKANIHVSFGNPNICGTTGKGAQLNLAQGFYAYQWEKDGQLIPGANSYTYVASIPGIYRARFSRISKTPTEPQWNRWSDPVTIGEQTPATPVIQQVGTVVLQDLNNNKNANLVAPAGFTHYYWYKDGALSTLPDANNVLVTGCTISAPPKPPCPNSGVYTVVTQGIDQCPSLPSNPKYVLLGYHQAQYNIITKPPVASFKGNVTSPSSILLTWSDAARNERGYEIWRKKSTDANTAWKMVVLTAEDVVAFNDTGLEPSTTYYYKIRGVNNVGRSDYTPNNSPSIVTQHLVITTTTDSSRPSPPQNLTATVIGINKISLSWDASTDDSGIKDYYVYYGTDSVAVGSNTTNFVLDNTRLVLNTVYNFTVRGVDLFGNLSYKSNQVTANTYVDGLYYEHTTGAWTDITTIAWVPPAVPEFTGKVPNITLAPRTQDDFFNFKFYGYLYLNVGSSGTTTNTSYAFQVNSNDGSELYIDGVRLVQRKGTQTDGACTSTSKTGLQLAAGPHTIEVRYFDYTGSQCLEVRYRGPDTRVGNGTAGFILIPDAKLKSYNTITPPVAPIAPINLTASAASMTQINLSWQFTGTPPVNYEIYRSTVLAGPFTMVARIAGLAFSDLNLTPGTTYYYKVRTVSNNGVSAYTSVVNATTLSDTQAPTQPSGLALAGSTYTNASFTWNVSTDNVNVTGYEVWANGTLIGTSAIPGYMATNLIPNTFYSFSIIAYDGSGNKSIASTPITTTTSNPDIYYSNSIGNLNTTGTWGKNPDGTGANVPTFSNNGQYFVVSNRTTSSLGGSWSVEGTISKVIVPNAVSLTVDNPFAARLEVQGTGTLQLNDPNVPQIISLSPTSTVNYNTPTHIQLNSYGNLGLNGAGNKVFPSGVLNVAGSITASGGVAFKGSPNNDTRILLGGNMTINGSPGFTAPDFGIQLEFTSNGAQSLTTGGDIYFQDIKTTGNATAVTVTNTGSPVTLNLGTYNGGGLSLANGTNLNIGNNNLVLTLSGAVNSNNETGKIGINGGNIDITSSNTQNSNLYFDVTSNKVNDLNLNLTGSGDLVIQENMSVSDGIKIKNGELNAGGHITLTSDATKTANIQEIEGTGTITGDMTVQRYIDAKGKIYRYLSSPVAGTKVADWQNYFPITGTFTGGSTGFTNTPSMYTYNNGDYQPYPPATGTNQDPIVKGVGYVPFLRNGTAPIIMKTTGNPYQGNVTFSLEPDPSPAPDDGWNLLGNPYASTIAWNDVAWTKSGIASTIGVRNNTSSTVTQIEYFDSSTGLGTLTAGKIAPGQAFWVRSISASPTLVITEKAKTTAQQTLFRDENNSVSHLSLTLTKGTIEDNAFIAFTALGTDKFDTDLDAVKLPNVGIFNLSTLTSDDVATAINNTSENFCVENIKINIQNTTTGSYTLSFNDIGSLTGITGIILHDNFTNADITVVDGMQYAFSVTANANSSGKNRLNLTFNRPAINTSFEVSASDVCGEAPAAVKLINSQNGIEYNLLNTNNDVISETVTGTGGEIVMSIPTTYLSAGLNTVKMKAGFKGCDSQLLPMDINFNYTSVPVVAGQQDVSVCQGSPAVLTVSGAPVQGSYKWYDDTFQPLAGATHSTFQISSVDQDTEFYVSAVTEDGCEGKKQQINISAEAIEPPTIVLQNDTLMSNGFGVLQWYKDGDPIFTANDTLYIPGASGLYTVTQTQNGCSKTSAPLEYLVTGLEAGNSAFRLSVYPNPARSEDLHVKIESPSHSPVHIKLISVMGKVLYVNMLDYYEGMLGIRVAAEEPLSNGVYIIVATQERKVIQKKIIIAN